MGWKAKEEVEVEEVEVIVIGEEDVEGVGREAQQGGEVHPSGATDSSFAGAAPTLEVQHAIKHAVDVSQGRALPANTTIIAPLAPPPQATSSLPGPGPSGALTPRVRKAIVQACEKAKSGAVAFAPLPSLLQACPTSNSPVPGPSPCSTSLSNSSALRSQCQPGCQRVPLAPAEAPLRGVSACRGSQVAP